MHRSRLLQATAGVALLIFPVTAQSEDAPSHTSPVASTAMQRCALTGRVLSPSGAPAAGAVVVTSAGSQAATAQDGSFALDLDVASGVSSVQLTAFASSDLRVSARVALSPSGGTDTGRLVLAASTGCAPAWQPTFGESPGPDGSVECLTVFDDGSGPALYAGGDFKNAGGLAVNNIAKWNGTTWSRLGSGTGGSVHALTVFDDGGSPALYAGGTFTTAGGIAASFVAKWNGAAWGRLGSGMNRDVYALTVFDDGSGRALYAGGVFNRAGGVTATSIAQWNGTTWSPVGGGMSGWVGAQAYVHALDVFDNGSGSALYVGGLFPAANGIAANDIARWDGAGWSPLGSGIVATPPLVPGSAASVLALAGFDDGSGPALYVGGDFATSPAGDSYLAKLGCALPAGARTFGTSSPGCTGALAIGVTSSPQVGNAAFAITCTNAPPSAPAAFLAGGPLLTPVPIQGVQLWVSPIFAPIVGSDASGHATVPLPIPPSPVFAGVQFDVQLVFLGPNTPPPCPPRALSASNALEITIQP